MGLIASLLLAAAAPLPTPLPAPPPAEPAAAVIHLDDAERFVRVFRRSRGRPDAAALQRGYLDPGSYGVQVFTPGRIESAAHLAAAIARQPGSYTRAIRTCLPRVRAAQADLRAIYAEFRRLLPDRPLPQIYVVFGAGNSGGTAGPGAQVLGLEVLCDISHGDPAELRAVLRRFFAHETVHTWQADIDGPGVNPLAAAVLTEGAADFLAGLVTRQQPDPARAAWAERQGAALWTEFRADLAKADDPNLTPAQRQAALHRWVANYEETPQARPYELGYWIGQQVWRRYYAAARDRPAALATMLGKYDPAAILAADTRR